MQITPQYVDEIGAALQANCPLASQDEPSMTDVRDKIVKYEKELDVLPDANRVIRWTLAHEARLQATIDAENLEYEAAEAKMAAGKAKRQEYLAPANKAVTVAEAAKPAATQLVPRPFKPRKNFSEEEIEQMDSETYARELMGIDNPSGRPVQGISTSTYLTPERPGRKKTRTIKLSNEEVASREYRSEIVKADEQEKKDLKKILRQAAKAAQK